MLNHGLTVASTKDATAQPWQNDYANLANKALLPKSDFIVLF